MAAPQHRHDGIYVSAERYDADERRRDAERAQLVSDIAEIKDTLKFQARSLFSLVLGFVVTGGLFGYFLFVKGG